MEEQKLQSFTMTNLACEIRKVIKIPHKLIFDELKQYVRPRLDYLNGLGRKRKVYFWFEESYVESEWKDMVSQHYVNTSYKIDSTVMRVHLTLTDEIGQISEKNYVGCFTLRNINEIRIMLSFIYPNWEITNYDGETIYVMSYRKTVHLGGKEITYHTYPLFVQDNAMLRCAQACLVSMSKYLNEKYHYNKVKVSNITRVISYKKMKLVPSWGLDPVQMLQVLAYYKIPVRYNIYSKDSDCEFFFQILNYTIESAIPVILGITIEDKNGNPGRHVIQIIGHVGTGEGRAYVIYDDSGYYLESIEEKGFVGVVTREQLIDVMVRQKSCIIYPVHERVYVLYDSLKKRLHALFENIPILTEMRDIYQENLTRYLLVDNRELKKFLKDNSTNASASVKEEVERVLVLNLPHYVWYCEVPAGGYYIIFLADPTYNEATTKNIFINKKMIIISAQFGLLNYGN